MIYCVVWICSTSLFLKLQMILKYKELCITYFIKSLFCVGSARLTFDGEENALLIRLPLHKIFPHYVIVCLKLFRLSVSLTQATSLHQGTFSAYFSLLRLRSFTRFVSSCCRFSSWRWRTVRKEAQSCCRWKDTSYPFVNLTRNSGYNRTVKKSLLCWN